jgi:hypothetical protein
MRSLRSHLGESITVRAHAERNPLRLTVTFTLGELPQGWAKAPRRMVEHHVRGIVGLVLIAPFAILIAAPLVHQLLGLDALYQWIATSPIAILAATASLFIGLPVAIALNAWSVTRLGLRRGAGNLEAVLALELAPLQLGVVLIALCLGALFVGHLAADSYACINGVHPAC